MTRDKQRELLVSFADFLGAGGNRDSTIDAFLATLPEEKPQRCWRVFCCSVDEYQAITCDSSGFYGDGSTWLSPRWRESRVEAEADGLASGLPEWPPAIPPDAGKYVRRVQKLSRRERDDIRMSTIRARDAEWVAAMHALVPNLKAMDDAGPTQTVSEMLLAFAAKHRIAYGPG